MRSIDFELPVTAGVTTIMLPALAWYDIPPTFSPNPYEPGESGIQLHRITVHVNGYDHDIDWVDEPWIDALCKQIYGRMAA